MKNDIAALINKLSQREMEEMLQKYASEKKFFLIRPSKILLLTI